MLAQAAHLRLSSETMGEIALHLRLRDGAAHVRVEADAARALEARAPELSRALAAEGIPLARLEVEQRGAPGAPAPAAGADAGRSTADGRGPGRNPERDRPEPPSPNATPTAPRARRPRRTGHDVTA